jgi:hypothetical protein
VAFVVPTRPQESLRLMVSAQEPREAVFDTMTSSPARQEHQIASCGLQPWDQSRPNQVEWE